MEKNILPNTNTISLVDVRCVANWYIGKTSTIEDAYHGLGTLNVFLYVLSAFSTEEYGYQFFNDRVVAMDTGPAFEKLVTYYSDQASYLKHQVCDTCVNFEFTPLQIQLLEKSYNFIFLHKPQRIRDWMTDEDSPWYSCYERNRLKNNVLSIEEVCQNIKNILKHKIK